MDGLKLCLFILGLATFSESANILVVLPWTGKSHYFNLRPIGLELARRGHSVTVITAFSEDHPPPNYQEVVFEIKDVWKILGTSNILAMDLSMNTAMLEAIWKVILPLSEAILNSTSSQRFLQKDEKFDVVIVEQFFQEAFNILAHKYQAPLILATTFGNCMKCNLVMRNPLPLPHVVTDFMQIEEFGGFWGRLRNWYYATYEYVRWRYWFLPKNEELIAKYVPNLPQPVPSLYEIQRNVSLLFVNSHFSFDSPVPYLPNIVEIGGIHLSKSNSKLPGEFQKILDNAKDGAVYVSFGSNVQSSHLPLDKKAAFLKVFGELKQTVIWKWEDETLSDGPPNLVIRKWMPQKEILAHPNVKVFISHGGLIGTQEAIYNGVPIIGIPIYADQYNNLLKAQNMGFGKILQYTDINEQTLRYYLKEMLSNNSYLEKAKEVSRRFSDRPMTALDTAVFWIEYVIRHKGADFIKSPALNMSWIEFYMVDVYGFVLLVILVPGIVIYKIVKSAISRKRLNTAGKKKRN